VLASCNKAPLEPKEKSTIEKIAGKWMLVKYQEQTYNAANSLIYYDERLGDQSDSLIFKPNRQLYIYSNTDGNSVIEYDVVNEQQIRIESEQWKIARLTANELDMITEEIDPVTKEKDVAKAFLKRP
jgi:hypothetical protein